MDELIEAILDGPWYENGDTWIERQLSYLEDEDQYYDLEESS